MGTWQNVFLIITENWPFNQKETWLYRLYTSYLITSESLSFHWQKVDATSARWHLWNTKPLSSGGEETHFLCAVMRLKEMEHTPQIPEYSHHNWWMGLSNSASWSILSAQPFKHTPGETEPWVRQSNQPHKRKCRLPVAMTTAAAACDSHSDRDLNRASFTSTLKFDLA